MKAAQQLVQRELQLVRTGTSGPTRFESRDSERTFVGHSHLMNQLLMQISTVFFKTTLGFHESFVVYSAIMLIMLNGVPKVLTLSFCQHIQMKDARE